VTELRRLCGDEVVDGLLERVRGDEHGGRGRSAVRAATPANWLEAAGYREDAAPAVSRARDARRHRPVRTHEVSAFLVEDAEKLTAFLGMSHGKSHGLVVRKA